MRRDKTSVSQEDYLKAIWEMLEEQQVPISARLAEELDVTPPAVTAAVKRMARDGHVTVKRGGHILLTAKGRKFAQRLMLRHQLAEMLLTEVIGLSWAKAHAEAEPMEHAISPEVEALLLKRFGDRKTCPHGYRLTVGSPGCASKAAYCFQNCAPTTPRKFCASMRRMKASSTFWRIFDCDQARSLKCSGANTDETMTVRASGHTMHLGKPATSRIWVRRSKH